MQFQPKSNRQRCCCEQHGKVHSHRLYRAAGKEKREPWNDRRRNNYHRRRARKEGTTTSGPVRRSEVAARDQWHCHLCAEPVNRHLVWPDPMSASLDHVVPLSRGGTHTPDNVRLAHLVCNTRKNNRLESERLAPTG